MTRRSFFRKAGILALCGQAAPCLRAETAPPVEKEKIEALIAHLENLTGATFVRNGSDYDPKTAAKFLRGKWKANDKEIKTAADFIAKAATASGTTGKPYVIRLQDGTETPCATYLTARLRQLEAAAKEKAPFKAGA